MTHHFYDHPRQMEPLLPRECTLDSLLERASDLTRHADRLAGFGQPAALRGLRRLLGAMNSYYTNKLEGQHTLPLDIERALRQEFSANQDIARRQRLALAHMATEAQLEALAPTWGDSAIWSTQTVKDIHQDLFARLDEADLNGISPGVLRSSEVAVGRHVAPKASELPAFLARWSAFYGGQRRGELQVVAAAAAHHRLVWIHPFSGGNGRVARLHTHLVLMQMGLTNGLWSPMRGFARSQAQYYQGLASADAPRAGDLDGRGNLTEAGLLGWIRYVLEVCIDQVQFMGQALALHAMQDRIAACLAFEEQVVRQGVRASSLRALHYLFATQSDLDRGDFKAMLGLGDRLATAQVSALLARGLIESDSPYGSLRFGVPQHALRFYFPNLWPEAEAQDRSLHSY